MAWRKQGSLTAFRIFLLLMFFSLLGSRANAQEKARVTGTVDDTVLTRIDGSVSPRLAHASDLGRLEADAPLQRILLRLDPSDQQKAALKKLVEDQHNPNSPMYHKWLTPEQFANRFGPADDDLKAVGGWLRSKGFTVARTGRGGQYMEFSGNSSQVEAAFHTEMHRYLVNGEKHISNSAPISIPAALVPVVKGLVSLNDFRLSSQISKLTEFKRDAAGKLVGRPLAVGQTKGASNPQYYNPNFGSNFLTPGDLAAVYDSAPAVKSGIDGTGVSIAVVGRSNVALSDIATFRTIFGLPDNLPQVILDGPDPGIFETGSNYDDEAEADLDVEYAGSIAPMATLKFVPVASTEVSDGIVLSSLYIVNNAIAPIVTASFGTCEGLLGADGNSFFNALWQQAAAEGMTALVSTGDYGSASCDQPFYDFPAQLGLSVNGMASTPYNVAVGGTEFLEGANNSTYWSTTNAQGTLASVRGYIPEIAWNDSCDSSLPSTLSNCSSYSPYGYTLDGGGGGASNCLTSIDDMSTYPDTITCTSGGYPKPSWQTGPGIPADGARDIPDVALAASAAHDPIVICFDGVCQYTTNSDGSITLNDFTAVGGTSAATPMMASIMAMVEQKNGQYLGQVNPILYQLAAKQSATSCNASNLTAPGTATACIFHDVTASTIAVPCVGGSANCSSSDPNVDGLLTGFNAGSGYDEATGLGSPDVTNLVNGWPSATGLATATTLSTSTASFVHGTPVTATVTVAPSSGTGTPSGNIVLEAQSNGVLVPQGASDAATLANGTVKESVADLVGGSYNLVARYAGDSTFAVSTSNSVALTVTPEPSSVALVVNDPNANNPLAPASSVTFGNPYYISAVVTGKSGQGTPTGSVSFFDGTTALGTFAVDQSGSALLPIGPTFQNNPLNIYLNPGVHNLSAKYSGDASFNAASGTDTLTIAKESPQAQVVVLPSNSNQPNQTNAQTNQTVLLQAVLASGATSLFPTGQVTITDNGNAIATLPLVPDTGIQVNIGGAQAVVSYAFKTTGTHLLSLTYAGDSNFLAVDPANVLTFTVNVTNPTLPVPTVQLYDFAGTVTVGTGIRYSAVVSGNGPTPTGTITLTPQFNWFSNENNPITPATLQYGVATIDYAWLEAEPLIKIVAVYSGDANYAPATSNVVTNTITQATPSVTISAASPYVLTGSQTTVTVSLNSPIQTSSPILTGLQSLVGKVQLYDTFNGTTTVLGSPVQTLTGQYGASNNDASIAIVPITLAAGAHSLTAQFLGNPNYVPTASSNSASIVVTNPDFAVTGSSSTVSISAGATGADTITVSPILGYSGTVAFACSGLPAGASCSFAPATVSGSGSTVVSIPTVAPSSSGTAAELHPGTAPWWRSTLAGGSALACVLLFGVPGRRRRTIAGAMMLALIMGFGLNGCGGEGVASTTLTLGTSAAKAASGTAVTLTVTLSSSHAAPYSGSVTFYDQTANAPIGVPEGFIGNQAQIDVDSLAVGTHQIVAKYSGDTHTTASQSSVLSQTITGTSNATITATSGSLSHSLQVAVTID